VDGGVVGEVSGDRALLGFLDRPAATAEVEEESKQALEAARDVVSREMGPMAAAARSAPTETTETTASQPPAFGDIETYWIAFVMAPEETNGTGELRMARRAKATSMLLNPVAARLARSVDALT